MPKPLDGVRVLDFTRLLPGAYATQMLADAGADVIKIEDPRGGDGMRTLRTSDGRPYFELLNHNKRSVTLDLRSPESAPVLDALASTADVTIESFRPSTARRLGVDAATLRAAHPRLICASISGFGQRGPLAEVAAHDINYQALAGLLRPPALPGPLVADVGAAMQAAFAVLAALFQRHQTAVGCAIDVSIDSAARAWSMFPATADLQSACYTMYETADGRWLALGALEEKFWTRFCERVGRPDLVPRQHDRGADGARVALEVAELMRTRTRDEWLSRFSGTDACLTPVEPVASTTPAQLDRRRAPALGADTDDVLGSAGIDGAARERLRRLAII